jgi:hypothetical protein
MVPLSHPIWRPRPTFVLTTMLYLSGAQWRVRGWCRERVSRPDIAKSQDDVIVGEDIGRCVGNGAGAGEQHGSKIRLMLSPPEQSINHPFITSCVLQGQSPYAVVPPMSLTRTMR